MWAGLAILVRMSFSWNRTATDGSFKLSGERVLRQLRDLRRSKSSSGHWSWKARYEESLRPMPIIFRTKRAAKLEELLSEALQSSCWIAVSCIEC